MTKQKSTKRALLLSALSLLMCISMFVGSTFAWFTDSVTSAGNKIVSGSLDIQLLMHNGTDYIDISESTAPIFGEGAIAQNNNAETLWEPGKTQVAYLAIKNNGNLSLKYRVGLEVQNVSKNLYEVMEYSITPDAQYDSVDAWNSANGKSVVLGTQTVTASDTVMNPGDVHYFALSIHMDELAGNKYQDGEVNFDLTIIATQATVESDSFGTDYDADALNCNVIATPETIDSILANATEGTVIGLAAGSYGEIVMPKNNLTLVSNSAVVDFVDFNGKTNCKIDGLTFDAANAKDVWDGKHTAKAGYKSSVVGTGTHSTNPAKNIEIINCTFTGTPSDANNYRPIAFHERSRSGGYVQNFTVNGCTFETNAAYYIYGYYPGTGTHKITNNVFGNGNTTVSCAVYMGSTQGSVFVEGNIFSDGGVITTGNGSYKVNVSVNNNAFTNTTDSDMSVIAYRNFPNGSTISIKDNTANFGKSEFKAPYVTSSNYTCYDITPVDGGLEVIFGTLDSTDAENMVFAQDVTVKPEEEFIVEATGKLAVDGNGATVNLNGEGASTGWYGYIGFVPAAGEDTTVSDLNVTGSGFVEVGHYGVGGGNYTIENLNIENLEATLKVKDGNNYVAAAFCHYGTAVINNCTMTGTTVNSDQHTAYDVGCVNKTNTTFNGGTYGSMYIWSQAHVTINGANIDRIDSGTITTKNLGMLTVKAGSHVGTINIVCADQYTPALTIEDGASVDAIVYKGVTYTQAEWLAR